MLRRCLEPVFGLGASDSRAARLTCSSAWSRLHLIRFHRVLAPNAKLRSRVVPPGPLAHTQGGSEATAAGDRDLDTVPTGPHRISWARLLKRVFDIDMQHCPNCGGGELKIIAAILERPVIEKILTHLGLEPQPPPKGRAREAGQASVT